MSKPNLTIQVRAATPTTAILDIHGEVTGFGETALMDAYTQASNLGARTICLNFTGLEYMNSSGIGLLVTLLIRIQRQKQRLVAYRPHRPLSADLRADAAQRGDRNL